MPLKITQHEAETIALNILNFLLNDEDRRQRFMTLTGMDPQDLRGNASDPAFLAGIVEYLLQDESLIYTFADEYNTPPDQPAIAHRALIGRENTGEFY